MDCNEVQKIIDMGFGENSGEIGFDIKSHIESCEICAAYFEESALLQNVLNKQKFEILPAELDDITFDNIVAALEKSVKKTGFVESVFSLSWAWIPAAAAAVFILFSILPNSLNITQTPFPETTGFLYSDNEYWFNDSDQIEPEILTSLISKDSSPEIIAEELLYEAEVDDLLGSLTEEELDMLYDRLNYKNGSVG